MSETPVCCVHLVDGASGAPIVLRLLIQGLQKNGHPVMLLLSNATDKGPLQSISNLKIKRFFFRWDQNRPARFLLYILSQIHLFFTVFFRVPRKHVMLINTLSPCGAALAAKLRGQRVIYHVHENQIPPPLFDWVLKKCCRFCAEQIIFVSNHSANKFPQFHKKKVISNALPLDFANVAFASPNPERSLIRFTACMAAYPKKYKGVDLFYTLAQQTPQVHFILALSSDADKTSEWASTRPALSNLEVWSRQENMHTLYRKCHVVLNLTIPALAIETFGLTALEGMAYGLPAIVPPVGGIAELVRNGEEGFHIDPLDIKQLKATLTKLKTDKVLYSRLSNQARNRASFYKEEYFIAQMRAVLCKQPIT